VALAATVLGAPSSASLVAAIQPNSAALVIKPTISFVGLVNTEKIIFMKILLVFIFLVQTAFWCQRRLVGKRRKNHVAHLVVHDVVVAVVGHLPCMPSKT
jgi:hypothetical protein